MKRGIYVVANARSEAHCANLIYSIRQTGCRLPIRLIPYGGEPVSNPQVLAEVALVDVNHLPKEALELMNEVESVATTCPRGFLRRFLCWFGDWDEFIYTDNDIVALMNWETLFEHLDKYEFVHADEEYTTKGCFNFLNPQRAVEILGAGAISAAFTAGHFVIRRKPEQIAHIRNAVNWYRANPGVAYQGDQALLNIASLLGEWRMLNLCKSPHNWLSSWAGDYRNTLALVQAIQSAAVRRISHLHFSGGVPVGTEPTADFLTAYLQPRHRMRRLTWLGLLEMFGWIWLSRQYRRIRNGIRGRWKKYIWKS